MSRKRKNEPRNKYLIFINTGFQMGLIIGGGVSAGIWIDKKFSGGFPFFTVLFSLAAVFAALFQVINAVKRLDNQE